MLAIQGDFDFTKSPNVVFSGEDCADLGGPRREFFRLLIQATCKELGVFEGSKSSLVFSHDHSVIANNKPFVAGQLIAWSILHGGPGPQAIAEDVFYLMFDLHQEVEPSRAAMVIVEDGIRKLAKELLETNEVEEFKAKHADSLLDQGLSLLRVSKDELLIQLIKQALLYR